MDIQLASNFERLIFEIQGCNSDKTKNIMAKVKENNYKLDETSLNKINKDFLSEKLSEDETINEIKEVFKNHSIVLDPHTAIGYGVAKKLKQDNITILSPPIRASYNSPFTLPMLKRNEVMYRINL